MESDAGAYIFSKLNEMGLLYNATHGKECSAFLIAYELLFKEMPVTEIYTSTFFRSRKIDLEKDVNSGKGITIINGKLQGGFNEENSWKPDPKKCEIAMGRMNRENEAVLYVAEDPNTALREQKAEKNILVSVASYDLLRTIRVLDFAELSDKRINSLISELAKKEIRKKTDMDASQLYLGVQRFFAYYDSDPKYYQISNMLCDLIKKEKMLMVSDINHILKETI